MACTTFGSEHRLHRPPGAGLLKLRRVGDIPQLAPSRSAQQSELAGALSKGFGPNALELRVRWPAVPVRPPAGLAFQASTIVSVADLAIEEAWSVPCKLSPVEVVAAAHTLHQRRVGHKRDARRWANGDCRSRGCRRRLDVDIGLVGGPRWPCIGDGKRPRSRFCRVSQKGTPLVHRPTFRRRRCWYSH